MQLKILAALLFFIVFAEQESCLEQKQKTPAGAASGAMMTETKAITHSSEASLASFSEPRSTILVVASFWFILLAFIPAFLLTFFPKIGVRIFVKNYRGMFTAS